MDINFNELFKDIIREKNDILYCKDRFKKLEIDFKKRKYNFREYSLNRLSKEILQVYLEYYGYSYAANKLKLYKGKEESRFIGKLLLDSNLISLPNIVLKGGKSNSINQKYSKYEGIYKEYKFIYDTKNFPFFIDTIVYDNTEYIRCTRDSSNSLSVIINIGKEEKVNKIENIVVYTSLGIETINVTIRCIEEKNEIFGVATLEDFLKLCGDNQKKALDIYMNPSFGAWVKSSLSGNQLINYEESIERARVLKNYKIGLKYYCISNGVFIKDEEIKEEIQLKDISENSIQNKKIYDSNIEEPFVKEREAGSDEESIEEQKELKQNNILIEKKKEVSQASKSLEVEEKSHKGFFKRLKEKFLEIKEKGGQ